MKTQFTEEIRARVTTSMKDAIDAEAYRIGEKASSVVRAALREYMRSVNESTPSEEVQA